jgi:pantoate--beta-alanine ligase
MKIVKTIDEVRSIVKEWRRQGLTVGLVPTMGYLHEGHASLIDASSGSCDKTVVSVFVNPMQFGPTEDLESYPRDIEHDAKLVEEHGGDIIFNPEPEEMYHDGFSSFVDMTVLTQELCGLSRPVHFRGVCTVVTKLFNIVQPDRAFFGEKDAQQLAVIRHMVDDLNMNLEIVGCPIVREENGLAKSSRNTYLSAEEKEAALVLSKSVFLGIDMVKSGEKDCAKIISAMKKLIEAEPLARIDYVKIVDEATMQQIDTLDRPALCAMAVYIGKTRLIDNFFTRNTEAAN